MDGSGLSTAPRWELFKLLSEPMRLRLLALSVEEEFSIGELAEILGESQPNVSRHVAPLRHLGLVSVRKEGTRTLVRFNPDVGADAVVADALGSGRELCESEGVLVRAGEVLKARDLAMREFFARESVSEELHGGWKGEAGAYVAALGMLLAHRGLAVDAGTGDGGLLDVLAPAFEQVIAVDQSETQLRNAKKRAANRGFDNIRFFSGELGSDAVVKAVGDGADVVFAVRLLHHAPRPAKLLRELTRLCAPHGALVLIEYDRHNDESMRQRADQWLGFGVAEFRRLLGEVGYADAKVVPIPRCLRGSGADAHLPWHVWVARRTSASNVTELGKSRPVRRKVGRG